MRTPFPPIPDHQLLDAPAAGAKLLSEGPVDVYGRRRLITIANPLRPHVSGRYDCQADRLLYLRHLAWAEDEELPLRPRETRSLQWKGEEHFVQTVRDMVGEIRAHHEAVIARLIACELLDEAKREEIPLQLRVRFLDGFGEEAEGLPDPFGGD